MFLFAIDFEGSTDIQSTWYRSWQPPRFYMSVLPPKICVKLCLTKAPEFYWLMNCYFCRGQAMIQHLLRPPQIWVLVLVQMWQILKTDHKLLRLILTYCFLPNSWPKFCHKLQVFIQLSLILHIRSSPHTLSYVSRSAATLSHSTATSRAGQKACSQLVNTWFVANMQTSWETQPFCLSTSLPLCRVVWV